MHVDRFLSLKGEQLSGAGQYEGILGNKMLAVGAAVVQNLNVERAETIVERIAKSGWPPSEQTMISSS